MASVGGDPVTTDQPCVLMRLSGVGPPAGHAPWTGPAPPNYNPFVNVFISHARGDQAYAARLREVLVRAGLRVWEQQDVTPGDNWALEVGKALDKADAVVVLLSPDAMASDWVKREIEFSISSQRFKDRLIPVLVRPTREVPWILRELPQWLEARDPVSAAESIAELLTTGKARGRAPHGEAR